MSSNNRIRFVGVLLTPSLASIITCACLSIFILSVSALIYNAHTGVLYNLLFGPDSSVDLIQSARTTIDAIFQTMFGNRILNKIIFFAFWCLVGLAVYLLFSGVGKTGTAISETAQRMHYLHAKKTQFEEQLGLRLIMYAVALLLSFIYVTFFMSTLLPFSILCGRIGLSSLSGISGWLYCLAGFTVLAISLHIFIVLVRLFLLRPRVFGGWDAILESETGAHYHNG